MRKIHLILALTAIFSTQVVFAMGADSMASNSKPCATVAKACSDAGFKRKDTGNKKFWVNCMKPILLGQTVQGVTVDPAVAKACHTDKTGELKKELKEFQKNS